MQVDATQLRKIAAVRGLVGNKLRARAWPKLLGIDLAGIDEGAFAEAAERSHRDSSTVDVDVERSLWSYTEGWSDAAREAKRRELHRAITASICTHPDELFYYQGYHDIAGVLLFVCGERAATAMLERLALHHLRDCTLPSLEPVLETLTLMMPLLERADPVLHRHLSEAGVPPFFAVSWMLTWHTHELGRLEDAARLFDLFLSSHPLMPLYAGVASVIAARGKVLAAERDAAELHHAISKVPLLGEMDADGVALAAIALMREHPPKALCRAMELRPPRGRALSLYPYPWSKVPQRSDKVLSALPPKEKPRFSRSPMVGRSKLKPALKAPGFKF